MSISTRIQRKLLASSGGFCANPACHRNLFDFFEDGEISSIVELAHIIGKEEKGPRGEDSLPLSERDSFDNIILLCPTCHTTIDKHPDLFPKETLRKWKQEHEDSIKNLFLTPKFKTREEARKYLQPFLEENKAIFDLYGPSSENAINNPSGTEIEWKRLSLQKLIPNNRRIDSAISQSMDLLTEEEKEWFFQFRLHREGFEFNKLSGDVNETVPLFPTIFESILK